ncbi:MAG: GtrA family protein, partial [Bacteroidetes bacterium]|nr:GtrA family protein [Bacteroidota bacterium]
MLGFLKAQAASVFGSFIDYLITILLVEVFHFNYVAGNLFGNIAGAIMQFLLCRNWAFNAADGKVKWQVVKFIVVWIGSLILSAAGIYLLTRGLKINYILSKTIISVILGLTYNYFLQKKFVFV